MYINIDKNKNKTLCSVQKVCLVHRDLEDVGGIKGNYKQARRNKKENDLANLITHFIECNPKS